MPTRPGAPADMALLEAPLRGDRHVEGGCFWVETDHGTRVSLVFPEGYSALWDDPPRLIGPDGGEVARVGDVVKLGGGFNDFDMPRCNFTRRPFLVNSVE